MSDFVYIDPHGKEHSAREACLKALNLVRGGECFDMSGANMSETLARYGFTERKKSFQRRFREAVKAWVRGRLVALGKLERYFV